MPRLMTLVALLALSLASGRSAVAGLIVNGSFEDPDVSDGGFGFYPSGDPSITGWTVFGNGLALIDTDFSFAGIQFQAQDGRQWADLDGGVSQTVATTIGATYELSFYVGSAQDDPLVFYFPTTINLSIDGALPTSYHNPAAPATHLDWLQFKVLFVAQNAATSIAFSNANPGALLGGLDNVSLTEINAVPEPSSLVLLATGGLIGAMRLRQRRITFQGRA